MLKGVPIKCRKNLAMKFWASRMVLLVEEWVDPIKIGHRFESRLGWKFYLRISSHHFCKVMTHDYVSYSKKMLDCESQREILFL